MDTVKMESITKEKNLLVVLRMPAELRQRAREKCEAEDINFSQLMRRALRKELARITQSLKRPSPPK